jgi:hypothetical protein
MTGTEILSLVTGAYDVVKSVGLRIVDLFAMGKVDETEALKLKAEYEKAVLNLDFQLKQAGLWMQEKLIAMEQATGARWRPPLILASGIALILAALNNILAACYFEWAHPIDIASPEMGVLAGMFLLLVTGSTDVLMRLFNGNKKPANPDTQEAKTKKE